MQGQISEAQLRKAVEVGARIRRAVLVTHGSDRFSLFVLLGGKPAWQRVAMRRYEGIRYWRTEAPIRRLLAECEGPGWHYDATPDCRLLRCLGLPAD